MDPELQKKFDQTPAYDMIVALKAMYQTQAKTERYEITKALWSCHMAEGVSVSEHVIKMFGYGMRLEALGFLIPAELSLDLVLASLPPSYNGFIMNYNMNGLEKTPNELLAMLKTAEPSVKRENNQVLMVTQSAKFKKKSTKKSKNAKALDKATTQTIEESECFFYKGKGHSKRNCKKFLYLKKRSSKGKKGIRVILK